MQTQSLQFLGSEAWAGLHALYRLGQKNRPNQRSQKPKKTAPRSSLPKVLSDSNAAKCCVVFWESHPSAQAFLQRHQERLPNCPRI
ncbi:MAG: hypothetical protein ACTSWW_06700 [Promethearchaeota archaeon]